MAVELMMKMVIGTISKERKSWMTDEIFPDQIQGITNLGDVICLRYFLPWTDHVTFS